MRLIGFLWRITPPVLLGLQTTTLNILMFFERIEHDTGLLYKITFCYSYGRCFFLLSNFFLLSDFLVAGDYELSQSTSHLLRVPVF